MTRLSNLTSELVRIDSVNPALDPNHPGEGEIARFVAQWAQDRGLEVQWLERTPGRPSVIVTARGRGGGGRTLLLNAHLDTVGVTGMPSPFEPRLEVGRLYGRGAMDMKASLAACLLCVEHARTSALAGDVIVTAVADEEHGSIGTSEALDFLAGSGAAIDGAIVTEPTDLELHVAHRGFGVFQVDLTGKASHTSRPSEGVNALTHLGRLLGVVEDHGRTLSAREPHPLLAHGSLQPVLAAGGHELFTTPAHASVTLERRTLPGEGLELVESELQEVLARLAQDDATFQATLSTLVARAPFEAQAGTALEQELAMAVAAVRGREPKRLGAPYWTDAALVAAGGIPTLLFGPVGGGIHQPSEWVDMQSAEDMLSVLKLVAERFCGG